MAWSNASTEEQNRRSAAGAEAFANLSLERQENFHLGAEAWDNASPEQTEEDG